MEPDGYLDLRRFHGSDIMQYVVVLLPLTRLSCQQSKLAYRGNGWLHRIHRATGRSEVIEYPLDGIRGARGALFT